MIQTLRHQYTIIELCLTFIRKPFSLTLKCNNRYYSPKDIFVDEEIGNLQVLLVYINVMQSKIDLSSTIVPNNILQSSYWPASNDVRVSIYVLTMVYSVFLRCLITVNYRQQRAGFHTYYHSICDLIISID